jgi:hypothetical protein
VILKLFQLLLLLAIFFLHGIYNYIPETNHVSKGVCVAAILYLQFKLQVMLFPVINVSYFYISALRIICAVLSTAV